MSDTLILNSNGKPVSVMPLSTVHWHLSVKLLWLNKASVLEYHDDWILHSPSSQMTVPSVMMLREYMNFSKKPRFSRYNVHLRDLFTCQYCNCEVGMNEGTLDHIVPKSRGGKSDWLNIVTACETCNNDKGSTIASPKKYPHVPNIYELENKRKRYPIYLKTASWNKYLNWPVNLINVA